MSKGHSSSTIHWELLELANNILIRCVSMLLEHRANVNVFDMKQRTPLLWAMETGQKQLFSLILDKKPTLEIVDSNGWNVGIYATRNGMLGDLLSTISVGKHT